MAFIDTLLLKLKDNDFRVRCNAVSGLGKIKDPRALSALLGALANRQENDPDRRVNFYTILALAKMGEYSILPLIKALKKDPSHPDDNWRRYWTALALGYREDKRAIEPLIDVLEDPDSDIVGGVVEALEDIEDAIGLGILKKKALEGMKKAYDNLKNKECYGIIQLKRVIKKLEENRVI
jgi:HEAT repeat protein